MFLRFTSKQTYRIFLFLHILFAKHHSLRCWYLLFKVKSGSRKISILVFSRLFVYRCHGCAINYITKHYAKDRKRFWQVGLSQHTQSLATLSRDAEQDSMTLCSVTFSCFESTRSICAMNLASITDKSDSSVPCDRIWCCLKALNKIHLYIGNI